MATETLYVSGDGDVIQCGNDGFSFGSQYEYVQVEDGAITFTSSTTNKIDTFTLDDHAANYGVINSVTVYIKCRKSSSSSSNTIAPLLRLSGTNNVGSNLAITTTLALYSQAVSRPGGGSWSAADIDDLQVGYQMKAASGQQPEVDYLYIVVDYTPGNHPSPASLECERATNPTNASDSPIFSAVWQANGGTGTATHAYIQVSELNDFSTTKWDSGWINIADISHGVRCAVIEYTGTELSTDPPDANNYYYWRIKFKDGSNIESDYSSTATFKMTQRAWWNKAYAFRRKILLNPNHGQLPDDTTLKFNIETGNRIKIATNGCFNEAIQEAGYMIAEFADRAHIVYLSETGTDGKLGIYIQSYNKNTKAWGTPYKIDDAKTSFDTHYYPTLCIDNNGYIHVFYGCHGSSCYYKRSLQPNQSGAFAGDGGWTSPVTLGTALTYPQAFVVPSTNRIVLVMRSWNGDPEIPKENKVSMFYSTDGGSSWSSERSLIYYTDGNNFRVYCYGVRFDPKRERLHLGFSFIVASPLNMTKGVWYAYSDFDPGNADGFSAWKKIDGSSCGITGTSPITYASAGAVRLNDTGDINIFFCRNVAITKTGDPLVFWATAPWYIDAWGQDAAFGMSRWNGSEWIHSNITEDYDIMMRSDRCGLPTLCDSDGVIHTYTALDSVVDKHLKPTGSGFYSDITVSGAATTYEAVDDGISFYDADDTFVGKTTATGIVSFISNASLPSDATVIAVGIDIVLRGMTGGEAFVPFLRANNTDYNGTTINMGTGEGSITDYVVKRNWWTTNPATGGSWSKLTAESVEFGIKQTVASKNWRVTRINKLVKIRYSTNDENFAAEIVELTSSDLGTTWTQKRLSDNSCIGVPILSIKHSYTNRRIELVWVSGNDIFYLEPKSYGKIRRDAKDVRVIWQGNGATTELHRVIDYANLTNTQVEFRVPEALSSGCIAGTKDIYVYYGNPTATGSVASSPSTVYPLLYENFETFADLANISGTRGWATISGTARAYSSPPNHNNKVFAGSVSMNCLDNCVVERSFSTTLTGVAIEFSVWPESASKVYMQIFNASGTTFSAGINVSSGHATYNDGTWHGTSVACVSQNMSRLKVAITTSGSSFWANNQLVCSNISGITSASKFRLVTEGAQAYYDFIRTYRWSSPLPVIELQPEEASGFTLDMALLGAGIDQFSLDMKLQDYYTQYSVGIRPEMKSIIQRDPKLPIEYMQISRCDTKSPIDFSARFDRTIKEAVEYLFGVETNSKVTEEYQLATNATYKAEVEYNLLTAYLCKLCLDNLTQGSLDAVFVVDNLASIENKIKSCYSYITSIESDAKISFDNLAIKELFCKIVLDYSKMLEMDSCPIPSWLLEIANHLKINIENLNYIITSDVKYNDEYGLMSSSYFKVPTNYLSIIQHNSRLPIEWVGEVEIARNSKIPICYNGTIEVDNKYQEEINYGTATENKICFNYNGNITVDNNIVIDNFVGVLSDVEFAVDNLISAQRDIKILSESCLITNNDFKLGRDNLVLTEADHQIMLDNLGTAVITIDSKIPLDFRAIVNSDNSIKIETNAGINLYNKIIYDSLLNREIFSKLPIEAINSIYSDIKINDSILSNISYDNKFPDEFLSSLETDYIVPLEWGEQGLVIIGGAKIPISWLSSLYLDNKANLENTAELVSIVGSSKILIDYGQSSEFYSKFYPEFQFAIISLSKVVEDWCNLIDADAKISISPVSSVERYVTLEVEFGSGVSCRFRATFDQIQNVIKDSNIPYNVIGGALLPIFFKNIAFFIPKLSGFYIELPKIQQFLLDSIRPTVDIDTPKTNETISSPEAKRITISGQSI